MFVDEFKVYIQMTVTTTLIERIQASHHASRGQEPKHLSEIKMFR